jgi:uncharacterized protein (DUF2235 family)
MSIPTGREPASAAATTGSRSSSSNSRNVVILFDGTSNQFGPENTNVVRLAQILERDSPDQLVYYDPGVGTLPHPGAFWGFTRKVSEIYGLAFGTGLTANVEEAYSYLMDVWQPGDRVFLFGFSRGAYTARVLAALLHTLGLLAPRNHNLVPYAMKLFKSVRRGTLSTKRRKLNYWSLCADFRRTFARPFNPGDKQRRFRTHFIGVWDTVSSVGWVWDPASFPYTAKNPSVATIRHAVSVDERRWFFRQNQFGLVKKQNVSEEWFPGVHGDVGGGYPLDDGLVWRPPFDWIVGAAKTAGLLIDSDRLARIAPPLPPAARPWADTIHESLRGAWWLAEYFPKHQWQRQTGDRHLRIGRGRRRQIDAGTLINEATLRRIRDVPTYRPPNLSAAFIARVLGLPNVPPFLAV